MVPLSSSLKQLSIAAGLTLIADSAAKTLAEPPVASLPESISTRRIIPLNHKWLYGERSSPEALQVNFNDQAFARINIPHTNKMLPVGGFAATGQRPA